MISLQLGPFIRFMNEINITWKHHTINHVLNVKGCKDVGCFLHFSNQKWYGLLATLIPVLASIALYCLC